MAQTYSDKPTLAAWNALAEAASGAPKIAYGTYVGSGKNGYSGQTKLTFDFEPKLLIVQNTANATFETNVNHADFQTLVIVRGVAKFWITSLSRDMTFTWDGNTVSWYNTSAAAYQLNASGTTYAYVAIG